MSAPLKLGAIYLVRKMSPFCKKTYFAKKELFCVRGKKVFDVASRWWHQGYTKVYKRTWKMQICQNWKKENEIETCDARIVQVALVIRGRYVLDKDRKYWIRIKSPIWSTNEGIGSDFRLKMSIVSTTKYVFGAFFFFLSRLWNFSTLKFLFF